MSKKFSAIILAALLSGSSSAFAWDFSLSDLLSSRDMSPEDKETYRREVGDLPEDKAPEDNADAAENTAPVGEPDSEETVENQEEEVRSYLGSFSDSVSSHKKSSIAVAALALIAAGYYVEENYQVIDKVADYLGLNDELEEDSDIEDEDSE